MGATKALFCCFWSTLFIALVQNSRLLYLDGDILPVSRLQTVIFAGFKIIRLADFHSAHVLAKYDFVTYDARTRNAPASWCCNGAHPEDV